MGKRTCDLGEVVAMVSDAGTRHRPVLVAVSGYRASGKTTLATRLHERIHGATVVEAELLQDTTPALMNETWSARQRARLRHVMPSDASVVIVEGRGLLHDDIADFFHLRVWLDVDLEESAMHDNMRAYDESRGHGVPAGRWTAEPPPERVPVDSFEAEFFARFRPDRRADVLFVPVGRMNTPIKLRFMTEIGCDFVLWDDENSYLGELEHLLPLSSGLRRRLMRHARQWYDHDGGEVVPDWPGDEEFDRRGYLLSRELEDVLGADYRVEYKFNTAEVRRWAGRHR